MARSGDTLLFVRVVATSSELGRAYELTQAVVVLEALSVSECGLCRPFDIPWHLWHPWEWRGTVKEVRATSCTSDTWHSKCLDFMWFHTHCSIILPMPLQILCLVWLLLVGPVMSAGSLLDPGWSVIFRARWVHWWSIHLMTSWSTFWRRLIVSAHRVGSKWLWRLVDKSARPMPTRLQRLTRSLSSRPWNGYQAKNCGILEHQNKNPKELLAFGFPASVLLCDRPRMDIVPDFKAPVYPASLFWRSLIKAASSNLIPCSRTYHKSS